MNIKVSPALDQALEHLERVMDCYPNLLQQYFKQSPTFADMVEIVQRNGVNLVKPSKSLLGFLRTMGAFDMKIDFMTDRKDLECLYPDS